MKTSKVKWIKQHGIYSKISLTIFGGKHKAEYCRDMVVVLVKSYKAVGCNMFLRVELLYPHLDFFAENLGELSDERGSRFH